MAMRSMPRPKAKPLELAPDRCPTDSKTAGSTIPAAAHPQPTRLLGHTLQPDPPQITQREVRLGRGFGEGEEGGPESDIDLLFEEISIEMVSMVPFKSAMVMSRSTTEPLHLEEHGRVADVVVPPEDAPGADDLEGRSRRSMVRICTGEVCVRSRRSPGR